MYACIELVLAFGKEQLLVDACWIMGFDIHVTYLGGFIAKALICDVK